MSVLSVATLRNAVTSRQGVPCCASPSAFFLPHTARAPGPAASQNGVRHACSQRQDVPVKIREIREIVDGFTRTGCAQNKPTTNASCDTAR